METTKRIVGTLTVPRMGSAAQCENQLPEPRETALNNTTSISVATEITAASEDGDVEALLDACEAFAPNESVFTAAFGHIKRALKSSYTLLDRIKDDPVAHQKVIERLNQRCDRKRSYSLKRAPYNCVCASTKPMGSEQAKQASEWASILLWATEEGVSSDFFESWVTDKSVGASKRRRRNTKSAPKRSEPGIKPATLLKSYPAIVKAMKEPSLWPIVQERLSKLETEISMIVADAVNLSNASQANVPAAA